MKRPAWTQRKERSNPALMRLMSWLSLRLGRRASRIVLAPAAIYFLLFSPAACKASRDYLSRALGRPAAWLDVWRHLVVFGTTIHDRIYLLNDRFDLFDLRLYGETLVPEALAEGHGAFLIGAHLGSFEVIRAIGRTQPNLRVAVTMYEENARRINEILASINPAAKPDVIALGQVDSMLKVRESLDAGSMIGILADRTLLGDARDSMRWLDFLGTPAAFPLGPLHMAAMLRRPVIFMTGLYRGGNRYDIHFEKLADFSQVERGERSAQVQAALGQYVALLEKYCRAAPYNWFNYFDFWHTESADESANQQANEKAAGLAARPAARSAAKSASEFASNLATNRASGSTVKPVAPNTDLITPSRKT
ncbi:acyl-CoA synthetase [Paraburkholderia phenazinium]|uniref:Predicted acyltransferase, LPLAT superfamily n=1 Tax=Paraburkholderia phenazinium TaxID=60549 RepID=A0A1G7UAT8_9BURK|nr:acyl-CoA synthetase [Paraburkholderia phenazinium]SDG44564.1 Predicted acyltransferase, LPLAT superfamily [Paraburkholderia phenazinium]